MKANKDVIQGKWLEIKGDLQKAWGTLTDDDLETTKGDLRAISGLIRQKYGEAKEKSRHKLAEIFERFEDNTDSDIEIKEKTEKTEKKFKIQVN